MQEPAFGPERHRFAGPVLILKETSMAKPITIGGEHFRTQSAAITRAKAILHGTPLVDGLDPTPLAGAAAAFAAGLYARHDRYDPTDPPDHVGIRIDPDHPWTVQFVAVWPGRIDPFSMSKAIQGLSPKARTHRAFRVLVQPQVTRLRMLDQDEDGFITCRATGRRLRPSDIDYDHKSDLEFAALVEGFLEVRGLTYDAVDIDPETHKPADPDLRDLFLAVHSAYIAEGLLVPVGRDWHRVKRRLQAAQEARQ
jgi:hypothetical protein